MGDKHSSNKILATIIALVIALIGGTGLVVATHTPEPKRDTKVAATSTAAVQAAKTPVTHLSYPGVDGKTALALLKTKVQVVTKQSAYGEYVDTIGDVKGGTNGKYWAFYVNGSMAQVGADAYVTKSGDTIEWKFE